jgi:alginate O-acetyltransferase complex protein AlgJ
VSDQQVTKRHHVTREEEADRDLNGTTFTKGSAVAMALVFLGVVFGVSAAQHVVEIRRNVAARAAWDPNSGQPKPPLVPKIYQAVELLPTREQLASAKGFWGYWSLIPSTERIEGFEAEVKDSSILTQALLSPAQEVLTAKLGVGNEKAYLGQPGWLFYRPDVEYLTSDGFLKPSVLKARTHGAKEIQPDPVKAIVDFNRQLAARDIKLVVMPMPTKPMIHPEMLVGSRAENAVLQNPSFEAFKSALAKEGVALYDPTPDLLARKSGGKQYLETDTHWTPEAMSAVAGKVADYVESYCNLPKSTSVAYALKQVPVSALGDIAEMLKLPKDQRIFLPQSVTTEQVVLPDGTPFSPQKDGDVLVMGDSFTNIFSLSGMNWGSASGFAEHLAYRLQRPVDKIAINAGGSFASRQELAREMRREDRLAGKRVVVYEFSMRDLAQGDWKMITLPKPPVTPPTPSADTQPAPPVPAADTTPVKVLEVAPPSFDPAKGQTTDVRLSVPKGEWRAVVYDLHGKPLVTLGEGTADLAGEARATWDGKDAQGNVVAPGAYRITVAGHREDGTKIAPVSASVLVTSGTAAAGKLQAIGAAPDRIDAGKGDTTRATFQVPAKGTYVAELVTPNGGRVRHLGRQAAEAGVVSVAWDGKIAGRPAPAGTYQIQLRSESNPRETVSAPVAVVDSAPSNGTGGSTSKPPVKTPPVKTPPVASQEIVVQGRIAARAAAPKPGSVPYKDCLIAVQITDIRPISGKVSNSNIVVYVWAMRDNTLVDGAFGVGQTVTLRLTPWDKVGANLSGLNRQELDDPAAFEWPAFFGELKR